MLVIAKKDTREPMITVLASLLAIVQIKKSKLHEWFYRLINFRFCDLHCQELFSSILYLRFILLGYMYFYEIYLA